MYRFNERYKIVNTYNHIKPSNYIKKYYYQATLSKLIQITIITIIINSQMSIISMRLKYITLHHKFKRQ